MQRVRTLAWCSVSRVALIAVSWIGALPKLAGKLDWPAPLHGGAQNARAWRPGLRWGCPSGEAEAALMACRQDYVSRGGAQEATLLVVQLSTPAARGPEIVAPRSDCRRCPDQSSATYQ